MIQSPLLPHTAGYIAGRWTGAQSGKTLAVINPATGEKLADVPSMGAAETTQAVEAAAGAFADPPAIELRRAWLKAIGARMLEHKRELGRIITLEQGKPLAEGVTEAEYAAGFFAYFADQLHHLEAQVLPQMIRNCRWTVHHRPAGVAATITPWNFPLAMMAKKIAPALGAGCTIVTKPASQTPLSAIAFWTIAEAVGVPAGRMNLIIGSAGPVSDVLCSHPAVRIISFTGSTEVGSILMNKAAPHIKRLALELGGNAPFLVFDDASIDAAADGLLANKFRAAGQTCVCTNRVYVQQSIAATFTDAVAERVRKLKVGNGLEEGIHLGPLIDRDGWDKVHAHVTDAIERGARRIVGDDPPRPRPRSDWGAFYSPTVLANVTPDMRVCREETFGPVVAISTFTDEADAVRQANSTQYGLAAYLYTADRARAERVTAQLQFGHVGVNTGTGPTSEAPFGGFKQSGFGREGGIEGLLEFCEPQAVAMG